MASKIGVALSLTGSLALAYDPNNYKAFLLNNKDTATGLPHSYYVPNDYFDNIPDDMKPKDHNQSKTVVQCNNQTVSADLLNAYEFQTEKYLSSLGLNIYDAAVRAIALAKLGEVDAVESYMTGNLLAHKTLQFNDIRGDAPCKGVEFWGECGDYKENGACGLCYGDGETNEDKSLPVANAYFFRMIGDYYSLEGSVDVRCPELGHTWTWNDYRPVLGENAWANLLGAMQVEFIKAGGNVDAISDGSAGMQLAMQILPALQKMVVADTGAIYYGPRNSYDELKPDLGSEFSTENQASTLAGLKALFHVLTTSTTTAHKDQIPVVQKLIDGIMKYFTQAYSKKAGYFLQGGSYDPRSKTVTWADDSLFATDCQTWVMAVLGGKWVDQTFGTGTALNVWQNTKKISGFNYDATSNFADGVGYSNNGDEQVFSGEWTLGAVNLLRNLAVAFPDQKDALLKEAQFMRDAVEKQLQFASPYGPSLKYASKRYYIPFGWWANPIPSLASTAWAVTEDLSYNVFMLGGAYGSDY